MTVPPGHGPDDDPYRHQHPGDAPSWSEYQPPGQPPYGHPAYGQYSYGPPRQEEKAIWALALSILGFVVCPVVLHIIGLVLANQSLQAIRASNGMLTGDGMAKAAKIISIVGLALTALSLMVVIVLVLGFWVSM